jgi:predicted glycosyltransferase
MEHGHDVFAIARDKEIAHYLLKAYGIDFHKGSIQKTGCGAPLELIEWFWKVYRLIGKLQIDLVASIGSPGGAWAAKLRGIPHLVFNDTENATKQRAIYKPAVTKIFTPNCFNVELGGKQVRYKGYHELAYLHPKYFTPDQSILEMLGVKKSEKFVIIRFVGWEASHDISHSGLSLQIKRKAVQEFSKYAKVFITSEKKMPDDLEQYRITIPPERIHDAQYYATLLYGESATMASECAILGTPAIYLDNDGRGYTDEQEEKYGAVFNFTESIEDQEKSIEKGIELLQMDNINEIWGEKRKKLLEDTIDVTAFIVSQIEKYSESVK